MWRSVYYTDQPSTTYNHPTFKYSSSQEVSNSSTSQTPIPAGDSEHFRFEFCDKSFKQNEDLQKHLQTHSKGHPHDGSSFMKIMESSIADHTRGKSYQCQYCNKAFKKKSKLKRHLMIHTGERPHQFQHCSKSFIEKSALEHHLLVHSGEKPHQCQYCRKSFKDKSGLKCHLMIHTGEKPYHCQHFG